MSSANSKEFKKNYVWTLRNWPSLTSKTTFFYEVTLCTLHSLRQLVARGPLHHQDLTRTRLEGRLHHRLRRQPHGKVLKSHPILVCLFSTATKKKQTRDHCALARHTSMHLQDHIQMSHTHTQHTLKHACSKRYLIPEIRASLARNSNMRLLRGLQRLEVHTHMHR